MTIRGRSVLRVLGFIALVRSVFFSGIILYLSVVSRVRSMSNVHCPLEYVL